MASKKFITLVVFFFVCSMLAGMGHAQGGGGDVQCLHELMPCQNYLKTGNPPPQCCVPLKDMIVHQPTCLCTFYNNDALLRNLNVTKEDTVKLVQNCGAKADISLCKPTNGSTPAHPTPTTPPSTPTPSTPSGSSGSGANLEKSLKAWIILISAGFVYLVFA